jgi:hypothetical protein
MPAKPDIFLVRYDECSSQAELFDALTEHVKQLPEKMESIKVLCHSIGATVMRRLLAAGWLEAIARDVEIIAVAPVSDGCFEPLQALNNEELAKISDSDALKMLQDLPFYIESPRLPLPNIRRQVMLLTNPSGEEVEMPFSRILLPRDDNLCITFKDAAILGEIVLEVDRFHDLSTVALESI